MSLKQTLYCLLLPLSLLVTACGNAEQAQQPLDLPQNSPPADIRTTDRPAPNAPELKSQTAIPDGEYPVQQATFDDADGEYTLMLLNAPSASFKTQKLQMARLTDEQIKEGKKSYLKVENQEPVFYLTEDFKIAYVHNVSEERVNPATGRTESTIVRQESNFWTPFAASMAGNIAGQVIGNMLFRPQYYVPPAYQLGGMFGNGGYGRTYGEAVQTYQQRYQQPPAVERNRTVLRTNGSIRSTNRDAVRTPQDTTNRDRSTGSGFGSSDLKTGKTPQKTAPGSGGSFGSGRGSRSGGFGSRRRSSAEPRFNVKTAQNADFSQPSSPSASKSTYKSKSTSKSTYSRSKGSFGSGRNSGRTNSGRSGRR